MSIVPGVDCNDLNEKPSHRFSRHDREILRILADHFSYVASLPVQSKKAQLWRDLNDLQPQRPMVFICQVPWAEMDVNGELQVYCEDPFCRMIETEMRRTLYAWCHFPVDMVVERKIACPVHVLDTGFGIVQQGTRKRAYENSVEAQQFQPQIRDEKDINKIEDPIIQVDWDTTNQRLEDLTSIFQDILSVEITGARGFWFAPWDELVRWYGVQEALQDMLLRPDFVHAVMDRLVTAYLKRLEQYEALGLLGSNNGPFRVGSGGLGFTKSLPAGEPLNMTAIQIWGCAAAQIFTAVSPEMHAEFALRHEKRWLEKFGLNYYGCCEALHEKIDILKTIPRLRKISISPKACLEKVVEQLAENQFVLSIKPNPAILAGPSWDVSLVRQEIGRLLKITQGKPVEIILKDISTVRFEPRRLWEWAQAAMELVEETL